MSDVRYNPIPAPWHEAIFDDIDKYPRDHHRRMVYVRGKWIDEQEFRQQRPEIPDDKQLVMQVKCPLCGVFQDRSGYQYLVNEAVGRYALICKSCNGSMTKEMLLESARDCKVIAV